MNILSPTKPLWTQASIRLPKEDVTVRVISTGKQGAFSATREGHKWVRGCACADGWSSYHQEIHDEDFWAVAEKIVDLVSEKD